jgi:hypothetical protein
VDVDRGVQVTDIRAGSVVVSCVIHFPTTAVAERLTFVEVRVSSARGGDSTAAGGL